MFQGLGGMYVLKSWIEGSVANGDEYGLVFMGQISGGDS